LRGLTDRLNQPQGRTFLRTCSAVLGDAKCGVDLNLPAYAHQEVLLQAGVPDVLLSGAGAFAENWFVNGTVLVVTGAAAGLRSVIKADITEQGLRRLVLWESFALPLAAGDLVSVRAGCDRLIGTCQAKFDNLLNFRGFPHIPGDDWLTAYPVSSTRNAGESRYQRG
jgi:uncharacterized phage protein (TIGR02218 family)